MANSRVCTLFWPPASSTQAPMELPRVPREGGDTGKPMGSRQTFVIGWNPRGFVIAVAQIVSAEHIDDVLSYIRTLAEQSRNAAPGDTQYLPVGLEIIGRIHSDRAAYDSADDSPVLIRMRETSGLWLEMENKAVARGQTTPRILVMYMCGYRQSCELHLIRLTSEEVVPVAPVILSPLARLSVSNVVDIVNGKTATVLLRGAESVLEGPILPSHCATVMQRFPSASELSQRPAMRAGTPTDQATATPSNTESPRRNDSLYDSVGGSFTDMSNDSIPGLAEEQPCEISARDVDPTQPPRMQYPTASSFTEFSKVMECVAAGAELRTKKKQSDSLRSKYPDAFRRTTVLLIAILTPILFVVSKLSHYSYVFNLLEYKLRETVNAFSIVGNTASSCGLHPILPHRNSSDSCVALGEQRRCMRNFAARVITDMALGIILCTIIDMYRAQITVFIQDAAWWGLHDMHRQYFDWFLGWPAGFKMNEDLTQFLGLICHGCLTGWEYLVALNSRFGFEWLPLGFTVLEFLASFGASFVVAWIADCTNLVTLHIRNLYHIIAIPYRMVTRLCSTLFLQFRGQKSNPLRNRREEGSYSADEMLLGMMLCTLCFFLMPTVALYYLYLASARATCWVLQEVLRASSVLFSNIPTYSFYLWVARRNTLSNGITLSAPHVFRTGGPTSPTSPSPSGSPVAATAGSAGFGSNSSGSGSIDSTASNETAPLVVEFDLVAQPMAFGDIFKELQILALVLFSQMSPGRIISFILYANNMKPTIDVNRKVFGHLVADPRHPKLVTGA